MKKILFISPVPEDAAAYRHRIKAYLPFLRQAGFDFTESSFYSPEFFGIVYEKGNILKKLSFFVKAFFKRLALLLCLNRFDIIFIQREVLPVGPPFLEWVFFRMGKKVIFDFDDAIYLPVDEQYTDTYKAPMLVRLLKNPGRLPFVIKNSAAIIAGNRVLADYALKYNKNVYVIPSSVDTGKYSVKEYSAKHGKSVIGWIGSKATGNYLRMLDNVFQSISKKYPLSVKCIGITDYAVAGVDVECRNWSINSEIEDIKSFDIGIMPLPDNAWSRGKCGFKAIQYMAVGIPVVCSPVGVNTDIVEDGVNGFLAGSEKEWIDKLSLLIENEGLRRSLGQNGRFTVEQKYSVKANSGLFLSVFNNLYSRDK